MILDQLADEIFKQKKSELRLIIQEELQKFFTSIPQANAKTYLNKKEASDVLGCSRNTFDLVRLQYGLSVTKIGKRDHYLRSEIEKIHFLNTTGEKKL